MQSLCVGLIVMSVMSALMIPFGFLITNLVMSKSQEELKEVLDAGVKVADEKCYLLNNGGK
jgi:hypothetical protein